MKLPRAHRYSREINGRSFNIEVLLVGRNRWRAEIARRPGATTALMPFYGVTPEQAVQLLTEWLGRVAAGGAPAPRRRLAGNQMVDQTGVEPVTS